MKTIDDRETQKQTKKQKIKQTKTEKLGFLQLICKASLVLKLDLELALSIILKQRELYESKHVAVECTCLKT